jgi:hypothetical protein
MIHDSEVKNESTSVKSDSAVSMHFLKAETKIEFKGIILFCKSSLKCLIICSSRSIYIREEDSVILMHIVILKCVGKY